MSILQAACSKT